MKLVHIEWRDSASLHGGVWHDRDEVKKVRPSKIVSIGWVIKETKKYIIIAGHFSPHQCSGDLCIPKKCIKKMKVIK